MTICYSEHATLTCPSCGAEFQAEVWMLVDLAERPDLGHALREGGLNAVECPQCRYTGPAGAPLLLHDGAGQRVYFAAPPGAEEHEWREQAQSLLYLLVGSLPEEARRPYLGDVQVEQELEGVRRALLRREGARRKAGAGPPQELEATPPARGVEHHVVEAAPPDESPDEPPIFAAVRALVAADNVDEFAAIVDEHPALLDVSADAVFQHLVEVAYDQGRPDVALALREARLMLAELRASRTGQGPGVPAGEEYPASNAPELPASRAPALPDLAYRALLRISSTDELLEAVRDHPSLLEAWADAELSARADAALEAGNERLARGIEERREILAELRAEFTGQAPLLQAIQALIQAGDEEELLQTLNAYPVLLTDAAQEALFNLAAGARAQGDQQLAEYAIECRAMLRNVREGLEEGES